MNPTPSRPTRFYFELHGADRTATKAALDTMVTAVVEDMLQPTLNKLQLPEDK